MGRENPDMLYKNYREVIKEQGTLMSSGNWTGVRARWNKKFAVPNTHTTRAPRSDSKSSVTWAFHQANGFTRLWYHPNKAKMLI